MLQTAITLLEQPQISAWAIGCGLGLSSYSEQLLTTVLAQRNEKIPYVFDADALVLLAQLNLSHINTKLTANCVLTPHPKEAATLLHCDVADIQNNRQQAAIEITRQYHCWTIVKGQGTVIASPQGNIAVNTTGNSGLSTAGSGDVLTGVMASFLAQGMSIEEAVPSAVWIHGIAADELIKQGIGPIGLTASELINTIRAVRNRMWATHQQHSTDLF